MGIINILKSVFAILRNFGRWFLDYSRNNRQSWFDILPFVKVENPLVITHSLDNYIIVVTGSNTGIGRATACDLVLRGATVVLACRDSIKGKEAVQYIEAQKANIQSKGSCGRALFAPLDLNELIIWATFYYFKNACRYYRVQLVLELMIIFLIKREW